MALRINFFEVVSMVLGGIVEKFILFVNTCLQHRCYNKDKMLNESKKIKDFVGFQEGAVVSREIVNKPSGTVTFFAFAQGQGLSEHKTPYDALVLIIDGEAEITIDKKPHHLKEGEMILMPANHPHALKAIKRFKMILTMIKL